MDLIETVNATLKRKAMLRRGDGLLIGVSGGSDSMSLLHVFAKLRHEHGFLLRAVHYNHNLHAGSEKDQLCVERFCGQLQVPLDCAALKVTTSRRQSSVEDAARDARRKKFVFFAEKYKTGTVALAHHRDDSSETVLMRVLRGTGMLGLGGIQPKSDIDGLTVIRPFYNVPKDMILKYAGKNRIPFRSDPTNKDRKIFRNKIRLDLLPYLERQYQKNIRGLLFQLAVTSADDYAFLSGFAEKKLQRIRRVSKPGMIEIDLAGLRRLHASPRRMVVRLAVREVQGNLNQLTFLHYEAIENLVFAPGPVSRVDLPYPMQAEISGGILRISRKPG